VVVGGVRFGCGLGVHGRCAVELMWGWRGIGAFQRNIAYQHQIPRYSTGINQVGALTPKIQTLWEGQGVRGHPFVAALWGVGWG